AALPAEGAERERLLGLAQSLDPEDVQLHYQIAIHGRQDLPFAPDEYAGFTMALMRMLAFRADAAEGGRAPAEPEGARPARAPAAPAAPAARAATPPTQADWPNLVRSLG